MTEPSIREVTIEILKRFEDICNNGGFGKLNIEVEVQNKRVVLYTVTPTYKFKPQVSEVVSH